MRDERIAREWFGAVRDAADRAVKALEERQNINPHQYPLSRDIAILETCMRYASAGGSPRMSLPYEVLIRDGIRADRIIISDNECNRYRWPRMRIAHGDGVIDLDCGCVFPEYGGQLGCLQLEDGMEFYSAESPVTAGETAEWKARYVQSI